MQLILRFGWVWLIMASLLAATARAADVLPTGELSGTYVCDGSQQPIHMTVGVQRNGTSFIQVDFGDATRVSGSYLATQFPGNSNEVVIRPAQWLVRPRGYMMVEIGRAHV